jgi:hypothetical protein
MVIKFFGIWILGIPGDLAAMKCTKKMQGIKWISLQKLETRQEKCSFTWVEFGFKMF